MGTAVAGIVATGVLAARGGYKARGIIDDATADKGEPLTKSEMAQLTWLCYAVPSITAASSVAAVVGVHTIHNKRHAALAGLYAVTSTRLDDYREEAEKLLGTKKTQQLNDAVAQTSVDRDGADFDGKDLVITAHGTELMYDDLCGREFTGSVARVEEAVNAMNRELLKEGEVSMNFFYDLVGLQENSIGASLGWSGSDEIAVRFGSALLKDGRSAIAVWFHDSPKINLGRKNERSVS